MSVSGEKLFGVFNAGWANQAGQHLIDVMKSHGVKCRWGIKIQIMIRK
ncbi:hypothetical protein [Bariatricus massiliensis]|uniref:Uncharacterized protein n=1 Tax=Bariatricus massiliensis TaxID=1745713 RepID=A0ABS8DK23_9FIRM|nr:hypothetical protein [Bariatricus massiliensis]MCB7305610.1 hypothetical protein [Bariatricus massiliensis]MCB7376164.1 hypothetical protein [Bariatricus massiliensis]MCB7388722.1 hypothetical protein [Bariatricus massiliensis]MCB7412895.1 hypothetical protein [Bariatricus massiliensis]